MADSPVSTRLTTIERGARLGRSSPVDTLWLVQELRARMATLTTIDAHVRDACAQIDAVLEKCAVAPT